MNYTEHYQRPPQKRQRSYKAPVITTLVIIALLSGYVYYALHRPIPPLVPRSATINLQAATGTSQLSWPANVQAAVAVEHSPVLETNGTQTSVAVASTAKVITALVVLQKKPLSPSQSGPTITLTDADAALYNSYVSQEGSVVAVASGEQITEKQMLEAMMLPSANNIADSLAIWAYGSLPAYQTAATQYLTHLGLHDTHIGTDASGFSPTTTSTAHDLVVIGKQAMDDPVLRQIVGQVSANDIPLMATVNNVNSLIGTSNIIGIKTGNTDQAGGVYLSASTAQVANQTVTVVTALVGAPNLSEAMQQSLPLITSAQANIVTAKLLAQHAIIGEYRQPWGGLLSASAQSDLTEPAWRGSTATAHVILKPISLNARAGQVVGNATSPQTNMASPSSTNIVLEKSPTPPPTWWRLLHPIN